MRMAWTQHQRGGQSPRECETGSRIKGPGGGPQAGLFQEADDL